MILSRSFGRMNSLEVSSESTNFLFPLNNRRALAHYSTVGPSAAFPLINSEHRSAIFVRAVPFALFVAVLVIRSQLAEGAYDFDAFDARWLYAVQAAAALLPLLIWRRRFSELASAPRSLRGFLLGVTAGLLVFLLWIMPLPSWTHLGTAAAAFTPVDVTGALRWDLIAARGFGAVLVVPVMEELFWRSFLMRWIDQRDFLSLAPASVPWFGVFASSAVFALAHDLWLAAFIAGLIYAQVYRRMGSLWYPILGHATTNLALAGWVVSSRAWTYW